MTFEPAFWVNLSRERDMKYARVSYFLLGFYMVSRVEPTSGGGLGLMRDSTSATKNKLIAGCKESASGGRLQLGGVISTQPD